MATLTLPTSFPFVLIPIVSSFWLNLHHILATYPPRKKAGIKVPRQYADWDEAEKDPQSDLMKFNIAQRSHANFLEFYPSFLASVLITGIEFPKFATISGTLWVISRYILHRGYGSKNIRNRGFGGVPATITLTSLWVGSTITLVKQLTKINFQW